MEWNFAPDVIKAAQEIGIGDRVIAHWTEAECQDQEGTVVGVEIHRYGKVEYAVHLDGDVSTTDGFTHDRSGMGPGTIRLLSVAPQPSLEGEVEEAVKNLRSDAAQLLRMSETAAFGQDLSVRVSDPVLLILSMTTAAALLQSLSADNARLREERDQAEVSRGAASKVALDAIAAQEAAEARLSDAVEALKPFAEYAPYIEMFVQGRAAQGGSPVLSTRHFRLSHFRAARQFLDTQGGGNG